MNYAEMDQALRDAKETLAMGDRAALSLARMLVGRLRRVESKYLLAQLKKELRDYDAVTGLWKENK